MASTMQISFDTPFFNNVDTNNETGFYIAIDEHDELIRGTLTYENTSDGQKYQLNPAEPAWAQRRKMAITVNQNRDTIHWKSTIDSTTLANL
jgi:hypothetical protein